MSAGATSVREERGAPTRGSAGGPGPAGWPRQAAAAVLVLLAAVLDLAVAERDPRLGAEGAQHRWLTSGEFVQPPADKLVADSRRVYAKGGVDVQLGGAVSDGVMDGEVAQLWVHSRAPTTGAGRT